jgi:hypothetical protein
MTKVLKIRSKHGFGLHGITQTQSEQVDGSVDHLLILLKQQIIVFDSRDSKIGYDSSMRRVRNLFDRVHRQHTKDWFTVADKLGQPGVEESKEISKMLDKLIKEIKKSKDKKGKYQVTKEIKKVSEELCSDTDILDFLYIFHNYKDTDKKSTRKKRGKIYILTADNNEFLKIGCTQDSLYTRVKRINSATGVMIPFGIKKFWSLKESNINKVIKIENEIHDLLSKYRVRKDKEFFNINLNNAISKIDKFLKDNNLELS